MSTSRNVVMPFLSIVLLSLSLVASDERRQNTSAADPDIELMNDLERPGRSWKSGLSPA
jgi:hypothetical protein